MEGESDPRKRFEEYLKEKEGQPIDIEEAEKAKKEMEIEEAKEELAQAQKSGFAVYGDEPSRAEKFKNDPEGELFKTELTEEELENKISDLTKARETLISFLKDPYINNVDINRKTTLSDLEKIVMGTNLSLEYAVSALAGYQFDPDTTLFDLPEELKEEIEKDSLILTRLKNRASSQ